jgi:dTDP-4-dehydrorhamnose 3,5-epimerase
MLPGVKIYELKKLPDERGFFMEAMRKDWNDLVPEEDQFVQANISVSYPGIIRAWHRHARGQVDYFLVLRGSMKICAYDDRENSPTKGELTEIVSNSERPQVVRIPGYYWHGAKTIGNETSMLLYLVNRLFDQKNPDEERRSWNDPSIIDQRTKKPYDWNPVLHK